VIEISNKMTRNRKKLNMKFGEMNKSKRKKIRLLKIDKKEMRL